MFLWRVYYTVCSGIVTTRMTGSTGPRRKEKTKKERMCSEALRAYVFYSRKCKTKKSPFVAAISAQEGKRLCKSTNLTKDVHRRLQKNNPNLTLDSAGQELCDIP